MNNKKGLKEDKDNKFVTIREKHKIKSLGKNLKKYKRELKKSTTNVGLLEKLDLPKLTCPSELASFLNIKSETLKKYCVAEKKTSPYEFLYRRFKIKKKSGGYREILAPKKILKTIQDKIYLDIVKKIEPSQFSHGFREGYSTVTNAKSHLNAKIIYNMDLKNFFPSIKFNQVLEVFKSVGYSGLISSLLAALCTIPPRKYLKKNNQWILLRSTYYKPQLHYLPQGAPTSPALSNLACFDLDQLINKIATEFKFRYTRYADDLTFSSTEIDTIDKIFRHKINYYIKKHGFRINFRKEHFSKTFKHRKVTGIIVHEDYISLPRSWIKKLRSAIHDLKITDLDKNDPDFISLVKNIEGRCAYAIMVNKEKYSHFFDDFQKLNS